MFLSTLTAFEDVVRADEGVGKRRIGGATVDQGHRGHDRGELQGSLRERKSSTAEGEQSIAQARFRGLLHFPLQEVEDTIIKFLSETILQPALQANLHNLRCLGSL
jgi:hypothetical protein